MKDACKQKPPAFHSLLVIPPTIDLDSTSVSSPRKGNDSFSSTIQEKQRDTSHRGVPLPEGNTFRPVPVQLISPTKSSSASLLIIPPEVSDNSTESSSNLALASHTGVPLPPELLFNMSNANQHIKKPSKTKHHSSRSVPLIPPVSSAAHHEVDSNMDVSFSAATITNDMDHSIQPSHPIVQEDCTLHPNQIAFASSTDRVEAAFEEMVDVQPKERSGRPLVVLDGANIGWHHGKHEYFSAMGLIQAIRALKAQYSIDIVAFLPNSYFRPNRYKQSTYLTPTQPGVQPLDDGDPHHTNDPPSSEHYYDDSIDEYELLQQLFLEGMLVPVPPGDHDDAYILHYARSHHGFIVSNDFYRDYIASMEVKSIQWSMQLWLQENRCSYAFVGDELVLNPNSTFSLTLIHYYQCIQKQAEQQKQREPSLDKMDIEDRPLSSLSTLAWMQSSSYSNDIINEHSDSTSPNMHELSHLLQLVTDMASKCFAQHRPLELRHTLFSRINILLQLGRIEEAEWDVSFVRQYLALSHQQEEQGYSAAEDIAYYERLIHDYRHCMEIDDDLL